MNKNYIDKESTSFFPFWKKEICVEDNRSRTMPSIRKGQVVGIREDAVLVRQGNVFTDWYPFNSLDLKFYTEG